MADKIVVMRDGIIEQIGVPLDLYDRPSNLFVASFIGSPSMNLIRGKTDGEAFSSASGLRMPLSRDAREALQGRSAVYGVRPEHFRLVSSDTTGCVALEVVVVEPMGSETQVVVRGPGTKSGSKDATSQDLVCVFRERVSARPGETIYVVPDVEKVHLFDAESGIRVDS